MSLNESQIQNAPQMLTCPKCGFMNYSHDAFCGRCQIGLSLATETSGQFPVQRVKADRGAKILNLADFIFVMMSVMGMYWYYFDRNGAQTPAQKQFRLLIFLMGSLGMLIVWGIKLTRKKRA